MKKFVNAELKEIEIAATAFGPLNPDDPDESKTAVTDNDGNIIGWRAKFGNNNASKEK